VPSSGETLQARKTWRTLEPLHGMIYFVPEAAEAYQKVGIDGRDGYFASRAAPMGAVPPEVVIATFFNFNPDLIHSAIPEAWRVSSPEAIVAARFEAVDRSMRRILGNDVVTSEPMVRAAELAGKAAREASHRVEGRPLAAGHASLRWPDQPHLALWHAQSILREFRGDGHIALLVAHGLSGIEALVAHGASGEVPPDLLRSTRGWSMDHWKSAVRSLRSRDWVVDGDELVLTPWGSSQRQEIEDQTDTLAVAPYVALGAGDCDELRSIVRPWSRAFAEVLFR
jgi:hypothetical protein